MNERELIAAYQLQKEMLDLQAQEIDALRKQSLEMHSELSGIIAGLEDRVEALQTLKDSEKSCGEISCDDCNARYVQLRVENEALKAKANEIGG